MWVDEWLLIEITQAGFGLQRLAEDVDAVDERRSGGRCKETAKHPECCRLAGAVGSKEPDDLTAPHLKADPVDRPYHSVAFDQALRLDRNGQLRRRRGHHEQGTSGRTSHRLLEVPAQLRCVLLAQRL